MTNHKTITTTDAAMTIVDHDSGVTSRWDRQADESATKWEERQYLLIMEYIEPTERHWLPTNEELDAIEAMDDEPEEYNDSIQDFLIPTHWDGPELS